MKFKNSNLYFFFKEIYIGVFFLQEYKAAFVWFWGSYGLVGGV